MNYYDEEIEINRESTRETGHIPVSSTNSAKLISSKSNSSSTEPLMSRQNESEMNNKDNKNVNNNDNNKSNNNNNASCINNNNDNNKNDKSNIETSESETDEDATQNDERQQKNYNILTSDKWKNLPIPQDLKEIMQNILKYAPQTIDAEYKLQPFMPEFVPSVGDVDAFLKVSCPDALDSVRKKEINEFMLAMGLSVLDEPSGRQSDPSLLSMKLRSIFTNPGVNNLAAKVPTARSIKDIDKWINEIEEIHRDQSINRINSIEINEEINIDNLMAEWPKSVEVVLNEENFPSPELDCFLENYLKIVSSIFDIPIAEYNPTQYVQAIHALFHLYLAVNETVDFK